MAKTRKKYSSAEIRAYWLGVGMAIGQSGGTVDFVENINGGNIRKSVENGYGREMSRKPASAKFDRRFRGRK